MKMVYEYKGISELTKGAIFVIEPNHLEIVTVFQSEYSEKAYRVKEYPNDVFGNPQHFHKKHFRPLSDVLAEISIAELVEEAVEC